MKEFRFAVIGLNIGKLHLEAIKECKRASITAICDLNAELAERLATEFNVPVWCTDYRELLDRDDIDAVCVCTPDLQHREMTNAFLEAGKDVLCEKPFALDTDDCRSMLETAKKTGRHLMVGQVARFSPPFALVKQLIDEGYLGELYFVESEYAHDYSGANDKPWRWDPRRHPVIGGGCHAIDLLRHLAGNPIEAYAYSNKKVLTHWGADDSTIAVLKFPNNLMGKVYVSTGCKREYTMRTAVYGTKGTVIANSVDPKVSVYLNEFGGKETFLGRSLKNMEIRINTGVKDHNMPAEIDEFCRVMAGEQPMRLSGAEGAATVAVAEAIVKSTHSGQPEPVQYVEV